ncbi:hypothetical protein [Halorubrum cibi]|uniref:Uncharacterized protein n=1 Tax=Halorubrum cibi TaxID=413815 RepID=A0A521EBV3_9EURY|nr:hypothetical protein [Halorubrum cibi]SMO81414.1 hypothetical protein SAMN06264867_11016 [Halorubrum cibi]
MSDQSGDEIDHPVMSATAVESAARTARVCTRCVHIKHKFPGGYVNEEYPYVGFWERFTSSLETRWRLIKEEHREENEAFDEDDATGQTKLVTDGGRDRRGDGSERSSVSIAREHLLGATVWAYGGGAARVRPWTTARDVRMPARLDR